MAKIEVTDISKLRPELLTISEAEIDRRITELQMAKEFKATEKERAEREAKDALARERIDQVIEGLKWLNANSYMSENATEKFMGKDRFGKPYFAPHLSFKKPK